MDHKPVGFNPFTESAQPFFDQLRECLKKNVSMAVVIQLFTDRWRDEVWIMSLTEKDYDRFAHIWDIIVNYFQEKQRE